MTLKAWLLLIFGIATFLYGVVSMVFHERLFSSQTHLVVSVVWLVVLLAVSGYILVKMIRHLRH